MPGDYLCRLMQTLLSTHSGIFRYEVLNGRQHLVAVMTMIVPGVLPGSSGPLYYPEDVITTNVEVWNGMPIVVYHPSIRGVPVSARDPIILNSQGIGVVLRSTGGNGTLQAEAWFDIEEVKRVDNFLTEDIRILPRLLKGEMIELSTGLKTRAVEAPEGSVFNGRPYTHRVLAVEPDHLAVLPDQIGACSLQDGCGVFANNTAENKIADWQKNLQKHLAVLGGSGMTLSKTTQNLNEMPFDEIREELCELLRSRFTQDEPNAWINEVYDTFIIYWQGDELWQLSYSRESGEVVLSSEAPTRVEREVTFVPIENQEIQTMPMSATEKGKIVGQLIANSCGCWKKGDEALLTGFTDEKLNELMTANVAHQTHLQVVNALSKGITAGDTVVQFDAKSKKIVINRINLDDPEEGDDDSEDDDLALILKTTNKKKKEGTVVAADQSEAEWLASVPASVRKTFNTARQVENTQKAAIIARLIVNVDDDAAKARIAKRYMGKDLEELQDLEAMLPKVEQTQNAGTSFFGYPVQPNFFGQQGGFVPTMNAKDDDAEDLLEIPTLEYSNA